MSARPVGGVDNSAFAAAAGAGAATAEHRVDAAARATFVMDDSFNARLEYPSTDGKAPSTIGSISAKRLGLQMFDPLGRLLQSEPKVTHLELEDFDITLLQSLLPKLPRTVTHLELSATDMSDTTIITSAHSSAIPAAYGTDAPPIERDAIDDVVACFERFEKLTFRSCKIDDAILFKIIGKLRDIHHRSQMRPSIELTTLDLSSNAITDKGAEGLALQIAGNVLGIQSLTLSENLIGEGGKGTLSKISDKCSVVVDET